MKRKYKLIIFLICLICIFSTAILIKNKISNDTFNLVTCELSFEKLPEKFDNYKIIQISDLHSMEFGEENCGLISKIDEIKPDLIVISGDMFSASDLKKSNNSYDRDYDEESLPSFKLLEKLAKKYEILYNTGNHEEGIDAIFNGYEWDVRDRDINNAYNRYINKLKSFGVKFVDNSSTKIFSGDQYINIYGIYYYSINEYAKQPIPKVSELEYLNSVDKSEFNILLSHDPDGAEILSDKNFDLILSGHIHGGIIRFFDTGLLDPSRKLFPKYDKGEYQIANSKLYVSVGLGNTKFMRINNTPELNLITLKKR